MFTAYIRISVAAVIVAGILVLYHLYLASSLVGSDFARFLYTLPAGPAKKGTEWPTFDLIIPVTTLSIVVGYSFPVKQTLAKSLKHMFLASVGFAILLVGILPIYEKLNLFPPHSFSKPPMDVGVHLLVTFICAAFFSVAISVGTWLARLNLFMQKSGHDQ